MEITGKQKRIETATEAADAVRESEMKLLRDRAAIAQKVREITSVPVGITGMQEAHRKQVQDVETTYNAIIEIARQAGISTVGWRSRNNRKLASLNLTTRIVYTRFNPRSAYHGHRNTRMNWPC